MLLLLPDPFFFFFSFFLFSHFFAAHNSHKNRSIYDSNRYIEDTSTCNGFNDPNRQVFHNRKSTRSATSRTSLGPACAYYPYLSRRHNFQRVNCPPSRFRCRYLQGATSLVRDLHPLPGRDLGGAEFCPPCTESASAVPDGIIQPNLLLGRIYNENDPYILPRSSLYFPAAFMPNN